MGEVKLEDGGRVPWREWILLEEKEREMGLGAGGGRPQEGYLGGERRS